MRRDLSTAVAVALVVGLFMAGCGKSHDTESSKSHDVESGADIHITSVAPELAEIGSPITIDGEGFGSSEDHTVSIGGNGINVEMEVINWGDNRIVAKIPDDPRIRKDRSYYYRVQSKDYKESSNLFQFSFK
jgi:3D (Asp-Asp-Asp) domain-containing protein